MKNLVIVALMVLSFASTAFSEGTVGQKVEGAAERTGEAVHEVGSDTKKAVKKTWRKAKDATCEMVNGKMECAAQKAKHTLQNAGDEVSDKADDVKKKVD